MNTTVSENNGTLQWSLSPMHNRLKFNMFEACMITGFVILLISWIAMTWLAFSSLQVAQKALRVQKPTFTLSITNAP